MGLSSYFWSQVQGLTRGERLLCAGHCLGKDQGPGTRDQGPRSKDHGKDTTGRVSSGRGEWWQKDDRACIYCYRFSRSRHTKTWTRRTLFIEGGLGRGRGQDSRTLGPWGHKSWSEDRADVKYLLLISCFPTYQRRQSVDVPVPSFPPKKIIR